MAEEKKVKKLRVELSAGAIEKIYGDWVEEEEKPDLECPGPDRDPRYLWCG
ncbi:MAG: hypothetical protein QG620_283 [Patescibacteria group bacterium]|nr:hypothetical protein [Patescibacteria group bacterium]